MNTLNETNANIAGEELGVLTFERVTGETVPKDDEDAESDGEEKFSFDDFMRETRRMTDDLLLRGDIDGAEAYMEARRIELQDHRFFIRKLNQAWFGFNGTYGDSPAPPCRPLRHRYRPWRARSARRLISWVSAARWDSSGRQ